LRLRDPRVDSCPIGLSSCLATYGGVPGVAYACQCANRYVVPSDDIPARWPMRDHLALEEERFFSMAAAQLKVPLEVERVEALI